MNEVRTWGDVFVYSMQNVWYTIISYLPEIIGAFIILVIGLAIAFALGKISEKLIEKTKLDDLAHRLGLVKELEEKDIKFRLDYIVGMSVQWFLIIATLIAVFDVLKIPQATEFLKNVALYIPNVIVALIIIAAGFILGRFIHTLVKDAVEVSGMSPAATSFLSALAKWSIFIFAFLAALIQLRIAERIIEILFSGFIIMISLAGGLAFGLGGQEKAKKILDRIDKEIEGENIIKKL